MLEHDQRLPARDGVLGPFQHLSMRARYADLHERDRQVGRQEVIERFGPDPQLVHLDGLNLSRAWCMQSIASALPADDPVRETLTSSAARHAA